MLDASGKILGQNPSDLKFQIGFPPDMYRQFRRRFLRPIRQVPKAERRGCASSPPVCKSLLFRLAPPKRYNVLGAHHAITGAMQTVTNRTYINTSSVMELLGRLRLLHSGSTIGIVLDNAALLDIELIFLPSYGKNTGCKQSERPSKTPTKLGRTLNGSSVARAADTLDF